MVGPESLAGKFQDSGGGSVRPRMRVIISAAAELKSAARHLGWSMSLAPGVSTAAEGCDGDAKQVSAGVAVYVPGHVGSEQLWPFGEDDLLWYFVKPSCAKILMNVF